MKKRDCSDFLWQREEDKENIDPCQFLTEKKRKVNQESIKSPFSIPDLASLCLDSGKKPNVPNFNTNKPRPNLPLFTDNSDIDKLEEDNPLYCSEYVCDIYEYLKEKELSFLPLVHHNYFRTVQTDINEDMRSVLLEWLVEVAEEFRFSMECLYLTKNYIDRYLSKVSVHKQKLQLVGVTCMLLAAKYEEVNVPNVDLLVEICDNAYCRQEIIETEIEILKVLEFTLSAVTENAFVDRYLRAASVGIRDMTVLNNITILTYYLLELALPSFLFVQYRPSLLASAAISVALSSENYYPWSPTLKRYTLFDWEDSLFQSCITNLKTLNAQKSTRARFQSFSKKFKNFSK